MMRWLPLCLSLLVLYGQRLMPDMPGSNGEYVMDIAITELQDVPSDDEGIVLLIDEMAYVESYDVLDSLRLGDHYTLVARYDRIIEATLAEGWD